MLQVENLAAAYGPAQVLFDISFAVNDGEVVTLIGTGLASTTTTAQGGAAFPTTLGGVQVLMNGTAIPIYSVTSTQLSVVVPFTAPQNGSLVTFQVNNNGTLSNEAKVYSGVTSPGMFTLDRSGIGNGAILHADFKIKEGLGILSGKQDRKPTDEHDQSGGNPQCEEGDQMGYEDDKA